MENRELINETNPFHKPSPDSISIKRQIVNLIACFLFHIIIVKVVG